MFRSPFLSDIVSLRSAMDQLVNESFVSGPTRTLWSRGGTGNGGSVTPQAPVPLDVYATNDAFVITAAVPGLREEDLEITHHQGTIILSGQIGNVAESAEAKDATWYLHEMWHGRFQRAITPPFEVDAERAEARFENGVLRVWLPKSRHAQPQRIEVRSGATAPTEAIAAGTEGSAEQTAG
jgi:HSP20 family protein